jgi:hypothetical protein
MLDARARIGHQWAATILAPTEEYPPNPARVHFGRGHASIVRQSKTQRSVPFPKGGRVNGEAGERPAQSRYCIRASRRGSQVDQPGRDVTTLE